jgi:hypothetical protein
VTSICGLSIPGGNLLSFLLSGIIFRGIESKDDAGVQS